MEKEKAIVVKDLKKEFKIYPDKSNSIKEKLLFFKRNRYEVNQVLKGIDFEIKQGEAVGLIGKNGCGKSTTLKLLNKIMYPTSGSIQVKGKISSLIELGAGFHPDMSGRENIYINASIFGLTKKQIDAKLADIIEFSELGEAIDNPVRTYSSGMYMRLAFSVAINVDADILLIDEILAVGDVNFQRKCFEKLKDIKYSGATIVIVSHSMDQIEQICDTSIWIEKGKIRAIGKPKEIHMKYLKSMEHERQEMLQRAKEGKVVDDQDRNYFCGRPVIRMGNGKLSFQSVALQDAKGNPETIFNIGDSMKVTYGFQAEDSVGKVKFMLRIYKDDQTHCYGSTILEENGALEGVAGKSSFQVEFTDMELLSGNYLMDVEARDDQDEILDSIHDTVQFYIQDTRKRTGICNLDTKWSVM